MRKIGIAALSPRPRTTKPAPGLFSYVLRGLAAEPGLVPNIIYMPIGRAPGRGLFPYVLRGLAIKRLDQVWCRTSDICRAGARRGAGYSLMSCAVWRSSGWTRSGAGHQIYADRARAGARVIPLCLARSGDRAAEPGLVPDIRYMPIGRAPGRGLFPYVLRGLAAEPGPVPDIRYMPIGRTPGRGLFPYVLRGLAIERLDQADIRYMPIGCAPGRGLFPYVLRGLAAEPGLVPNIRYMPIGRAPGRGLFPYVLRGLAAEPGPVPDIRYMPIGRAPGRGLFPYVLRGLAAEPGLVPDIKYMPIGRGFLCLVALMDGRAGGGHIIRVSRHLRKSSRPSADRRSSTLTRAASFTSAAFTGMLVAAGIRISMDAAAAGWTTCHRALWRSSTRTFNSKAMPTAARRISASPPGRPHQALASRTPMAAWRDGIGGGFTRHGVDMTCAAARRFVVGSAPTGVVQFRPLGMPRMVGRER